MYRLSIWLIALALVFNGVATYAWSGPFGAQTAVVQDRYDRADVTVCDMPSDSVLAIAPASGHPQGGMHNHLKCCGTCTVASLIPDGTAVLVTFSYTDAAFHTAQHNLVGHLVAIDPDIPKSIV